MLLVSADGPTSACVRPPPHTMHDGVFFFLDENCSFSKETLLLDGARMQSRVKNTSNAAVACFSFDVSS